MCNDLTVPGHSFLAAQAQVPSATTDSSGGGPGGLQCQPTRGPAGKQLCGVSQEVPHSPKVNASEFNNVALHVKAHDLLNLGFGLER